MDTTLVAAPGFHQQVLDALHEHIAVLDAFGDIVAVNRAWSEFCVINGGSPAAWGVGSSYCEVCWRAERVHHDPDAARVNLGIRAVLAGTQKLFTLEYPCHSPTERRWFLMTVTPLVMDGAVRGAVVAHLNITRRKQLEEDVERIRREMAASLDLLTAPRPD
jgi:PAS domain-containing protein